MPDLVARHYRLAGDKRFVDWLIKAGENAQLAFAWPDAAEHYRQALQELERLGERLNDQGWLQFRIGTLTRFQELRASLVALAQAQRIGVQSNDHVLEVYSAFMRGVVESFSNSTEQVLSDLESATIQIGELVPDELEQAGPLRTALFGEILRTPRASSKANLGLGTLALRLASTGRYAAAEVAAQAILDVYPAPPPRGDDALVPYADACTAMAFVFTIRCEPDKARLALHHARKAYRDADDRRAEALGHFAELSLVVDTYELDRHAQRTLLAERAAEAMQRAQGAFPSELPTELFSYEIFWIEGDWEKALRYAGVAPTNMGPEIIIAEIALSRGNLDLVQQIVDSELPEGPDTEPGRQSFLVQFNLILIAARSALASNDLDLADSWIECFERWIDWSEMIFGRADLALLRAERHFQSGAQSQAREQAMLAIELALDPPQALTLLPARRLIAKIEIRARHYGLASDYAREAFELATACKASYDIDLARIVQAEILLAQGDPAEAEQLLDAAASGCTALGAQNALLEIEKLRVLLAEPAATPAYPSGLSSREVEVLRLVAEGLTDADVAERLFHQSSNGQPAPALHLQQGRGQFACCGHPLRA